jgi:hypothetical protein
MSEQTSRLQTEKKNTAPGYLETIAIATIIAAAALFGYDQMFAEKIVVVDLKKELEQQKALLTAGAITEEQWKKELDRIEAALDQQAAEYPHHIFVLKEVVLKNGNQIDFR